MEFYRKMGSSIHVTKKILIHTHVNLGDTVIAEKLIRAGANLNESDKAGDTPLMAAATRGIALLSQNIHQSMGTNRHKLSHHTITGNADIVTVLVHNGADVRKVNNRGLTALDIAINYGSI